MVHRRNKHQKAKCADWNGDPDSVTGTFEKENNMATIVVQRGGKKGRKIGRDAKKCAEYRSNHGGRTEKKFSESKEHRGCGPLGYYLKTQKHESPHEWK